MILNRFSMWPPPFAPILSGQVSIPFEVRPSPRVLICVWKCDANSWRAEMKSWYDGPQLRVEYRIQGLQGVGPVIHDPRRFINVVSLSSKQYRPIHRAAIEGWILGNLLRIFDEGESLWY